MAPRPPFEASVALRFLTCALKSPATTFTHLAVGDDAFDFAVYLLRN